MLEEALIRAAVPYRIYGGQRFYERLEIRNALAYLRLLLNRGDDAAVERVINTPPPGYRQQNTGHGAGLRPQQGNIHVAGDRRDNR